MENRTCFQQAAATWSIELALLILINTNWRPIRWVILSRPERGPDQEFDAGDVGAGIESQKSLAHREASNAEQDQTARGRDIPQDHLQAEAASLQSAQDFAPEALCRFIGDEQD